MSTSAQDFKVNDHDKTEGDDQENKPDRGNELVVPFIYRAFPDNITSMEDAEAT
jgi:hypothetical protein